MWEIIMLPKNGNPKTDWSRYTRRYAREGYAKRIGDKLIRSGLYELVIVQHEEV